MVIQSQFLCFFVYKHTKWYASINNECLPNKDVMAILDLELMVHVLTALYRACVLA